MTTDEDDIGPIQPRRETAQQFRKTTRHWSGGSETQNSNFPRHIEIKGLKYYVVRRLQQWKGERARETPECWVP